MILINKEVKMETKCFSIQVNIPNVDLFVAKHKAYGNYVLREGKFLFKLIVSPESFLKAKIATDEFEYPAVAGIAKAVHEEAMNRGMWSDETKGYIKQCTGAIMCALMEANGYRKSGRKKAIPFREFTKGEVYEEV